MLHVFSFKLNEIGMKSSNDRVRDCGKCQACCVKRRCLVARLRSIALIRNIRPKSPLMVDLTAKQGSEHTILVGITCHFKLHDVKDVY